MKVHRAQVVDWKTENSACTGRLLTGVECAVPIFKPKNAATVREHRKGVWGSPNIARPSCLGQSVSCASVPLTSFTHAHEQTDAHAFARTLWVSIQRVASVQGVREAEQVHTCYTLKLRSRFNADAAAL